MAKYLSVEFVGPSSNLIKFIESKGWNFETKHIATNKVFLKLNEDLAEEVKFFEGVTISDNSEDKMTSIKLISESEYTNTAENGFEIIPPHVNIPETKIPIIPSSSITEEVITTTPVNAQGFPSPLVPHQQGKLEKPKSSEDMKKYIAQALTDTVLPSKSPLPSEDPFVFLTSGHYLRNFVVASTVLLFILALFD